MNDDDGSSGGDGGRANSTGRKQSSANVFFPLVRSIYSTELNIGIKLGY